MLKLIAKLWLIVSFVITFIWQMSIANFRVSYYIIMPGAVAKPGVIAYPLDSKSDVQLTFLAIILSLTPGTLALDISPDKKYMYIHSMSIDSKKALIDEIKNHFEHPIMRILSWS